METRAVLRHVDEVMRTVDGVAGKTLAGTDTRIARSWARCARNYHLAPDHLPAGNSHPVTTAEENRVQPKDPPQELRAASEPSAIESVQSQVLTAIERCRWNMTHAAAQLGISRNTLYRRIKQLGIPLPHARRS